MKGIQDRCQSLFDIAGRFMGVDAYKAACTVDLLRQNAERMCKPFECISNQIFTGAMTFTCSWTSA